MKCWGLRMRGVVAEDELEEEEWDQVKVSKHSVCSGEHDLRARVLG